MTVHHTRGWRIILFATLLASSLIVRAPAQSPSRSQWLTLAEVLRQHSVPMPATGVDTAMRITSFDVIDDEKQFAIAYYEDFRNDELKPPLYVARYEKSTKEWAHRAFAAGEVKMAFTSGLNSGAHPIINDCGGSATLASAAGVLLVGMHMSPSAECTLVLRPDLSPITTFSGWIAATVGSTIVYEESEVHFASTHPLRLSALNLHTGERVRFFPPAKDPLRDDFQKRLTMVTDTNWCREHDSTCDPKQISMDGGEFVANANASAIAFEVMFSSAGFGPKADAKIGGENYFYVFKLAPKIEYREFDEFDMKPMFGGATPDVLVQPDILQRIFAKK